MGWIKNGSVAGFLSSAGGVSGVRPKTDTEEGEVTSFRDQVNAPPTANWASLKAGGRKKGGGSRSNKPADRGWV